MRILRVQYRGRIFYAALHDDHVICLNKELGFPDPIPLREVGVMPTVMPSKIVCAAVNYRAHGEELGHDLPEEPRLFLKPPSSVIASGQAIVLPPDSERVDHEGELAVVIGRTARNLRESEVDAYVFGYTCANDVTARDLQRRDGLFGRAKGFDTFCPIGPWIETEVPDPDNLAIRTVVNDTVRQSSSTAAMIFPVRTLVSFVSRVMTLNPGDVILTGTPEGVGPLRDGDEVRVEIEGVGMLINPVTASAQTDAAFEAGVQ
ncbi:fumarylacetoacetate (FAA) hydrolase [Alkalidesulfovibrio alkalitolerans DSM 16529]|uniref:Fumarylacetoacetate (FAA) hydrolase n=1 Tax=Alkalidesulfovibrio alkalitolerans DSM 16529 TaxID=1121439 RepID=S7UTX8_9BACT|nr:fumarylacetoacetate hydrolase family protein [Alkalidesulfovibrio alkalitolerans]EPR35773.1 fumarylacetoacetate (FAA) hydrolase [Alkalidesulfovibrio alkalitolerans DSM 16529]